MNKYDPKIDPNNIWSNIELSSQISYDLAEKVGKGIRYGSESSI
jgi:hypothetical protein